MTDRAKRAELANRAARDAGRLLLEFYGQLSGFDHKGAIDLVTEADYASETFLVAAIRAQFPNDAIVAEEGSGCAGTSGWEWFVDPLDGTTNFVHGYPFFMVSIGLRYSGKRTVAACFSPVMDELFTAQLGDGAFLNGNLIGVSQANEMTNALVATGFPYNRRDIVDELLAPVRRIICTAQGLRRGGAAAYDQCLLACGRVDGFFEVGLSPWDTAAGSLIIEEAGGVVESYAGPSWHIESPSILASNGHIQSALRHAVVGE